MRFKISIFTYSSVSLMHRTLFWRLVVTFVLDDGSDWERFLKKQRTFRE